jgi:hypothetical protein
MTLLAAGLEASAGAVSKKVGTARRRRLINKAEPVTDATMAGSASGKPVMQPFIVSKTSMVRLAGAQD